MDLGKATCTASFETSFERPDRLSFSVSVELSDGVHRHTHANRIFMDGTALRAGDPAWRSGAPTSLGSAVAQISGTSSGSAHTIPRLLLPERVGGRGVFEWAQRALGASAIIDGANHFVIELDGRTRGFVNDSTWLIRRIETTLRTAGIPAVTEYFSVLTPDPVTASGEAR